MFHYTGADENFRTQLNEYRHYFNLITNPEVRAGILRRVIPTVTRRLINIINRAATHGHLRNWLDDNLERLRVHIDEVQRIRSSSGLGRDNELNDLKDLLVRPTNYCALAAKATMYGLGIAGVAAFAYRGLFSASDVATNIAASDGALAGITAGTVAVGKEIAKTLSGR